MGEEKSGSFIPKRNPIRRSRKRGSKQLFIFTIISYVSVFAAVVASAGVFFYSQYTDSLLVEEVAALDTEIANFEDEEMREVLAFENRLKQAAYRFDHSVSVRSLFEAIEDATISTVQFSDFSLERIADESYVITANLITDSFDSTIYQRGVMERNPQIASVLVSNAVSGAAETGAGGSNEVITAAAASSADEVRFDAELSFAVSEIPLEVQSQTAPAPVSISGPSPNDDANASNVEEPVTESTL
jgi:hypothetical protein